MATTAARSIVYSFSGDTVASKTEAAANNLASPGEIEKQFLASGNNAITPPASPYVPRAVTIVMVAGNTATVTLKGVNGDTGVALHKTDPTSLGLNGGTTPFVLHTNADCFVTMVWH